MKRSAWLIGSICLFLTGCTSVQLPKYVQDKNPYTKEFYAHFDETLAAARQSISELDWKISDEVSPAEYEQTNQTNSKQVLLFTQTKQTSMFLFTRYTQINVYVRELKNATAVEVRYAVVTALPLKQFRGFRNDYFVNRLFALIAKKLDQ